MSNNSHYKKYISYYLILLFFLVHLSYLNTPFVNHEWAYRDGSQAVLTSNENLLSLYFLNQANPITYSFLSSLPLFLFGDHYATYRVFSLLGGTLLLIFLVRHKKPFLILIVGLNPLIWIYSGRGYSDIASVGIMMMALETRRNGILKGILGFFAAIIKYQSIVVTGCYWGFRWLEKLIKYKSIVLQEKNFLAGVISIFGLLTFFLVYYLELGILIYPNRYNEFFKFDIINTFNNFFSYGFYLSGMFFLTIPFHLQNTTWRWQIVAIIISIPLAILNQDQGEMGFGSFNMLLGIEIILLIKIFGFWNFLLCCKIFWNDEKSRMLLLTVLLYMAILSFTRPASRYLIFVIPFWAIMICLHFEIHRVVKIGYLFILFVLNIFASLYQVQNAQASLDIAAWSQNRGIQIHSGEIWTNVGNFSHHNTNSKIIVKNNPLPDDKILFSRVVEVLGYPLKEYFVVHPNDLPRQIIKRFQIGTVYSDKLQSIESRILTPEEIKQIKWQRELNN